MSEEAKTISKEKCVRTLTGKVVSNKMDKTIVVLVVHKIKHPVYGKYIKHSSKIHAHDEENVCREGDIVTITESRPISRTKRWKLVAVVEKVVKS
ncbi:MAG: 30S ribosomal protein S17 [Coxiellaceae bacterium]|jgi:small subunit ribosomal protein S17|nr:30S ribosomal protein S17 [Coxiellaceae bacterium]